MSTKEIQENLTLAQTILEQWLKVKQFFLLGTSTADITEDDEAEYLATSSSIAQNIRKLGQRIDEKRYPFRKEEISALMKSCISVQHFRNMPQQDQKKFLQEWHVTLVFLSRTVGAFKFLADGYVVPVTRNKKAASAKQKAMIQKVVIAVVVVAVLGGAAAWFFELV